MKCMQVWSFVGTRQFSLGPLMVPPQPPYKGLAMDARTGAPFVLIYENDLINNLIYNYTVMTYDNNSWSCVGPQRFTPGNHPSSGESGSLAVNPITGAPYVAFYTGTGDMLSVMTYTSGAWSYLGGSAYFTPSSAPYYSLAVHPTTGDLYVAFGDGGLLRNPMVYGGATVMTFDGTSWSIVGSRNFSPGKAGSMALHLHPITGAPYLFFQDEYAFGVGGTQWTGTVMTFDGDAWSVVGWRGFTTLGSRGTFSNPNLWIDPTTGNLYVAYTDGGFFTSPMSAMTFDGYAWSYLGSPGVTGTTTTLGSTTTAYLSMTGNPITGDLYAAFRTNPYYSNSEGQGLAVMTWRVTAGAWSYLGAPPLAPFNERLNPTIVANPFTGAPFVFYRDSDLGPIHTGKASVLTYG